MDLIDLRHCSLDKFGELETAGAGRVHGDGEAHWPAKAMPVSIHSWRDHVRIFQLRVPIFLLFSYNQSL